MDGHSLPSDEGSAVGEGFGSHRDNVFARFNDLILERFAWAPSKICCVRVVLKHSHN
ncbi:MAG: hypothetical protein RLZZ117_2795 [Cyanobacteriota bacterium]|jgi:hypothetical protein